MGVRDAWDAVAAIASLQETPWKGIAWRAHRRKYLAIDPGGSIRVSGRYNRGLDRFPPDEAFPALYLALEAETCVGEIVRHIEPKLLSALNDYRISELTVEFSAVLDLSDPLALGVTLHEQTDDLDLTRPQALGAAAFARGVEAIIVPSATRLGNNLVIFTTRLLPRSTITVVASRDPRLYIPRD
jgi:RES domain-containing protein